MASNPIKRRARQSFFLGFLIALVIMAAVVMLLFTKISSLNEENEKLKIMGPKVQVYTVNRDIDEGEAITLEDIQPSTMQLSRTSETIDVSNYIDPSIFSVTDEETGETTEVSYTSKVMIPQGSVVTLSMLKEGGVINDERLMEYNMIVLPTQLKNGDYIDIRLRLPDGKELIVISKKKVEQCTLNTIWLKMDEIAISYMNSAIVDAATVQGSQLRAVLYTDPIMQDASTVTYPINDQVVSNITTNPNILIDARQAILDERERTYSDNQSIWKSYRNNIESYTMDQTDSDKAQTVGDAYNQEATNINNNRSEYVASLEGTGLVGTVE